MTTTLRVQIRQSRQRKIRSKPIWVGLFLLCLAPLSIGQPSVQFKEFTVGLPFDIALGPDGAMWFTNSSSIGRITATGSVTTFPLPKNSVPTKIAAGPDGALWFTESPSGIGRIAPDGTVTDYPLSNLSTQVWDIAAGPDGALWFSEWTGGRIGRITTSGTITEFPLPRYASIPSITAGPDGAMWFTETNEVGGGGYVGRITMSGSITEFLLPAPVPGWAQWGFNDIVTGPDGALWVTDGECRIMRVTTTSVSWTEYRIPGCPPAAGTGAIVAGQDKALWFTLIAGNSIGRITMNGAITLYPISTPNSQPMGMAVGLDGSIWVAEHAAGKIGHLTITQPDDSPPVIAVHADPEILWPPNQRVVPVRISGSMMDSASGVLASSGEFAVTDEYGLIQPRGHITIGDSGGYSFLLALRASREGSDKDGRHYWIRVSARDNAGNRGVRWIVVTVPHER